MTGIKSVYSGSHGSATWEGRRFADAAKFDAWLSATVRARVEDAPAAFEMDMANIATTGVERKALQSLLKKARTPRDWQVGECLVECALVDDAPGGVIWPWNNKRDLRTPCASLPGADLIGFHQDGADVRLLIGEVKTSSDANAPPNVMHGTSGMAWQLHADVTDRAILNAVLQWLAVRCKTPALQPLFQQAVRRCLRTRFRDVMVVGGLVRDTADDSRDLAGRGRELASLLPAPTRVRLYAWYLPVKISSLPSLLGGSP